jgi:hypothetical protein
MCRKVCVDPATCDVENERRESERGGKLLNGE